jgi:peptide/nickel transport system permease protein
MIPFVDDGAFSSEEETQPGANVASGSGRLLSLGRRMLHVAVSLWVLLTAAFLMIHLVPGDPVRLVLGDTAPPELIAARRHALGLDRPLLQQYFHYVLRLAHGDMGSSLFSGASVSSIITAQLPATLALALLAFGLTLLVSIPAGTAFAVLGRSSRYRGATFLFAGTNLILATIPSFLSAEVLAWLFAVRLGWLPIAGNSGPASYILPVVSLSLGPIAVLILTVRAEMSAELGKDYMLVARSKRLAAWRLYLVDALPNALTATLTLAGIMLAGLVAGTVLVENVFAWPGLGTTMIASIQSKDYPLVQGIVVIYGSGVLVINFAVDVALALFDPRQRRS